MKKLFLMFAIALLPLTGFAQLKLDANGMEPFEQGKLFAGASLTGLDLSYSGMTELNLGLQAQLGYTFADNWLGYGLVEYSHSGLKGVSDSFMAGVGGRYYISQNGLFLGANCKYIHSNKSYNDVMPGVEIGYAFFISRTVTIEPAIYYQQSFKDHSDYSKVGLRIGFGIYLE